MILTRTPLRISLGGGGTDLPAYSREHGGCVISAAIDKYVYIALNSTTTDDYLLKYSALERVERADEIQHDLIRSAFTRYDIPPGLELVSIADLPAGTGLGSSGSFSVGLLRALFAHLRLHCSTAALAHEATKLEAGGKQDQYIAAYGGITRFRFNRDDSVTYDRPKITAATLAKLEDHLLLFYTGAARPSAPLLAAQAEETEELALIAQIGAQIGTALETGDLREFGHLMHEHWRLKQLVPGVSSPQIRAHYHLAREAGALGGKLVGAGGGGFLLFYASDPDKLRAAMTLPEVRFGFDHDGSQVIAR